MGRWRRLDVGEEEDVVDVSYAVGGEGLRDVCGRLEEVDWDVFDVGREGVAAVWDVGWSTTETVDFGPAVGGRGEDTEHVVARDAVGARYDGGEVA